MNGSNAINWEKLLDRNKLTSNLIQRWSDGELSSRFVSKRFANGSYAGEFRKVLRTYGTTTGRRLARKAINYREKV